MKRTFLARAFLGAGIAVPSFGVLHKFVAAWAVPVYCVAMAVMVSLVLPRVLPFCMRLRPGTAVTLGLVMFFVLLACFGALYPLADRGWWAGGSDRDEDCDLLSRALLTGQYPYDQRTYLGNALTHLPGSGILAAPFVLLGDSAYQNFFWLLIFFVWSAFFFKDRAVALALAVCSVGFSPAIVHELMTGGDLPANALSVLVALAWCAQCFTGAPRGVTPLLAAAFLGVALASRLNYLLVLPLLVAFLFYVRGARIAWRCAVSVLFFFLAVTVPYYMFEPHRFAPLAGQFSKLSGGVAAYSVLGLSIAAACALSLRRMSTLAELFGAVALSQAVPVAGVLLVDAVRGGVPWFAASGYGIAFLFFAWVFVFSGLTAGGKTFGQAQK